MAFDDCRTNPIKGCPDYQESAPIKVEKPKTEGKDGGSTYVEGTPGLPAKYQTCDLVFPLGIYCE